MSNFDDDITARLRHGLDRGAAPELSADLVTRAADHPAPRLSNPARSLRIAGGAGLAVAALTVGALVVAPSINRPPLFIAAAAGQAGASDAISSEAMKIGWWVDYNYTAGAGLSNSGGSGEVYQLVLDGKPEDRAADIADIFGVDGEVQPASYSDASYPIWVVGAEDGSAPSVTVTWSGAGDWWYSDPAASSFYLCDPSVTAEQSVEYGCTFPEDAPENKAPSEDAARTEAQQLLASTGLDVNADELTVYADDYGTTVTANLVVDGVKTALDWTISWSNTGGISYAYGHTVSVESRGDYGTVSAVDAVDRLEDGRWWGSAGPDHQGGAILYAADLKAGASDVSTVNPEPAPVGEPSPEPAPSEEPNLEPAPPAEPTAEPVPVEPLPVDPMPTEIPTPEAVDVTIDNAEQTLLLMWDADGNAWLVPGFAMEVDNGGWNSVVSLVEGVIVLPDPVVIEPMVTDTVG